MIKVRSKTIILVVLNILLLLLVNCALDAFARGGGGGGGGGGGSGGGRGSSIISFILLPGFFIYSAILTYLINKKNQESAKLTEHLESLDPLWDMETIKARVEETYFRVQEAWMARNQDICRNYVSDRLYNKHKMQTDLMIQQGRVNMLQDINLLDCKLVQISDFQNRNKDSFWMWIRGSMIDYIIDDQSNAVISGDSKESHDFTELWKFIRQDNNWLLDEIHQTNLSEIASFHSVTEGIFAANPEARAGRST